uniref:Uncharacterized protein n=1 Tax=Lactuca sativa TaxID=4236 RepID=A0A9R1VJQ5_LACSA|nr:hypothetical protein LSAT_V11C500297300 [Lactuca sativa]
MKNRKEGGFESFHVLGSCCSKPDMISGLIWEKWINLLTTTRYLFLYKMQPDTTLYTVWSLTIKLYISKYKYYSMNQEKNMK